VLVLIAGRSDFKLATAPGSTQVLTFHDPLHRAVRDLNVLAIQLLPDFLCAVDTITVGVIHPQDLALEHLIALSALTHRRDLRWQ